jgi:aminopeptidase N
MRKILTFFAAFLWLSASFAQIGNYRSSSNKYYWKNRKPFEGYWQQDVHYQITARLDDKTEIITGSEKLTYYNNSPDTLYEVYFHLYQNAFQPGSYMHELMKQGDIPADFGKYEALGLGTQIISVEQEYRASGSTEEERKRDGIQVVYPPGEVGSVAPPKEEPPKEEPLFVSVKITPKFDNTIMILKLKFPVVPGGSTAFYIDFKTYFDSGSMRRRMKRFDHDGVKHFDGVHWYPRICVYDRKFGWETDQHLGKEFYGDYGVYEVELQLPNHYIVEATGTLTNEAEAMPPDLRKKLDVKNFTTYSGKITEVIKPDGTFKSWKYHAENVHDFAFTADPSYRIGEVIWNGIRCIALCQEPNAPGWQKTAQFVADVVQNYSEDFGMYGYPKMVAADARDGMEYPMLTLDGGNWPGHKYVIAHEIGHNWFYGMVGNNETYTAALDEGFTQFLTSWSLRKSAKFNTSPNPLDPGVVYFGYMNHATNENTARLNVHSDHFGSAERHGGGYGQVYYKTATMLYNMQYVLGDHLFLAAMSHYFNQWKFAHPYWEDFRNSIINYSGVDLNWFFDQWTTTTETIDYKIKKIKRLKGTSTSPFVYEVTFERKGEMQMPLDIRVTDKKGTAYNYYIPNTYFHKDVSAIVLPTWKGWDIIYPTYKARIKLNAKLKNLEIDPSQRMADIYRLDNSKKLPLKIQFDKLKEGPIDYLKYHASVRPDLWYNTVDQIKAGIHANGHYFNYRHKFEMGIWYNTGIEIGISEGSSEKGDLMSYKFNYSDRCGYLGEWKLKSRYIDGAWINETGYEKRVKSDRYFFSFKSIRMNNSLYQHRPDAWTMVDNSTKSLNNSFNIEYNHPYKYLKGTGNIKLDARASAFTNDYSYSWLGMQVTNNNKLGKSYLKTMTYGKIIAGTAIPKASSIYIGGANDEELLESKYTRSRGWVPDEWAAMSAGLNNFYVPGGLNVRAYSNYQASNNTDEDSFYIFRGNAGVAFNVEWDFTGYVKIKAPKLTQWIRLNTYLFGDAGMLWNNDQNSGLRADAGLGTLWYLHIPKLSKSEPLGIRVDFPFFMNRIPQTDTEYFAFRWLVGLHKTF